MNTMLLLPVLAILCCSGHVAVQRNVAHPGVVHGVLWFVISSAYICFQSELNHISLQTIGTLALGIVAFSIGVGKGASFSSLKSPPQTSLIGNVPLPAVIVVISTIGLAMMIFQAVEYTRIWASTYTRSDGSIVLLGATSWLQLLRYELVLNYKGSLGLGSYVLNFCFAGVAYLIIYFRRVRPTLWLWPAIALASGFALVSTGRTFILLLGCILIGAAMPTNSRSRNVVAGIAILGGVCSFFLLPWLQGRLYLDDSYLTNSPFVGAILSYFLMPTAAFNYMVITDLPSTWGSMTFRTPLVVLRVLGVPVSVPDLVQPFVKVPAEINVYTALSPYYRDFGLAGVAIFMLFLGTLHGWVFRQLKAGMPIIIVGNALLFYALLMQFFQDQYFSLMSQWIQILGWTYVFNKLQPLPGIAERDRQ